MRKQWRLVTGRMALPPKSYAKKNNNSNTEDTLFRTSIWTVLDVGSNASRCDAEAVFYGTEAVHGRDLTAANSMLGKGMAGLREDSTGR